MRPAGFFLILILIYILLTRKTYKDMFSSLLTIGLFFACTRSNLGQIFMLGGVEIEYNDVILGALFICSVLILLFSPEIDKSNFIAALTLITIVGLGIWMCYLNPVNIEVVDFTSSWDLYMRGDISQMRNVHISNQCFMMAFRLIIFILIILVASKLFDTDDWILQLESVGNLLQFFIGYSLVELICKYILKFNITEAMRIFWGHGRCTVYNLERLQGLSREPSYFALALFTCVVVFSALMALQIWNRKRCSYLIGITLVLGAMSGSFSFLICFISLLLILCSMNDRQSQRARIIFTFLTCIVIALVFMIITSSWFETFANNSGIDIIRRINEAVKQLKNAILGTYSLGQDYSSEASRFVGGLYSLKAGLMRPIVGLGLGTAYCTMGIPAIIANIGLLGFIAWMYLIFRRYGKIRDISMIIYIMIPYFFCSDLYTLYDTSFLLILPIIGIVYEYKEAVNE